MSDDVFYGPYGHAPVNQTPGQFAAESERHRREEDARIDKAVKARQRETAELEAARERQRQEDATARLEAHREAMRSRVLAAGGTTADFAAAWPELKQKYLLDQAASDPGEQLYQRMRSTSGRSF